MRNKRDMRRRGGSRAAETSKMEHFVIIVNGYRFQPLTVITKRSILHVAAVLDPPPRRAWDVLILKNVLW